MALENKVIIIVNDNKCVEKDTINFVSNYNTWYLLSIFTKLFVPLSKILIRDFPSNIKNLQWKIMQFSLWAENNKWNKYFELKRKDVLAHGMPANNSYGRKFDTSTDFDQRIEEKLYESYNA